MRGGYCPQFSPPPISTAPHAAARMPSIHAAARQALPVGYRDNPHGYVGSNGLPRCRCPCFHGGKPRAPALYAPRRSRPYSRRYCPVLLCPLSGYCPATVAAVAARTRETFSRFAARGSRNCRPLPPCYYPACYPPLVHVPVPWGAPVVKQCFQWSSVQVSRPWYCPAPRRRHFPVGQFPRPAPSRYYTGYAPRPRRGVAVGASPLSLRFILA